MHNKLNAILTREHDKLCILEKMLNKNKLLETLVSNYIDSIINQDEQLKTQLIIKLTNIVNENILLYKIISLSMSIANQTPFKLLLDDNEKTRLYIEYLNQPYLLLLNSCQLMFTCGPL
jgi:hypothetical protein